MALGAASAHFRSAAPVLTGFELDGTLLDDSRMGEDQRSKAQEADVSLLE